MACWLLDLFTPYEEAESIPGDLYEEFSIVVGKYGPKSARRWYWGQSCRSIAQLIAAAIRTSPWSIAGAVIAAIFLLRVGAGLPERAEFTILNWGHVYHSHWYAYVSWMNNAEVLILRLLLCLAVGFFVGFLAKGRELVASLALVVIMELLFVVATHSERFVGRPDTFLQLLIRAVEFPVMIALGAGLVRDVRLSKLRSEV